MSKENSEMNEFFKNLGYHRHKQNYRGKGYYFYLGGFDLTRRQAEEIFAAFHKPVERNWYIVDKDYPEPGGMPILGAFSTATDASVAREYIERKSKTDRTYWLEERKR